MLSFEFFMKNIAYILGLPLFLLLPFVHCQSKKKFETDGKAELVARTPSNPISPNPKKDSSSQICPTAQIPPATIPLEKTGTMEEDTLANVVSLPPEKSEDPDDKKKKKKKR